jgi:hypothetical protein
MPSPREQLARGLARLSLMALRPQPGGAVAACTGSARPAWQRAATAACASRAAAAGGARWPFGLCGSSRAFSASAAEAASAQPRSLPRRLRAVLRDYKQLSKAKLSALVVLTASAGFAAGSDGAIDWAKLAWTSLGTFGAAACANGLNQAYEMSNDALMARTRGRPLPAGRMSRAHALAFAAAAGAAGLWMLAEKVRLGGSGRWAQADA